MKFLLKNVVILIILSLSTSLFSQISFPRIEPPFWWAGMNDTSLQLMIYGQGMAETNILTDSPGITVSRIRRSDNPNYLFVDLEIAKEVEPGGVRLIFEYQREVILSLEYELKA
ncbi:MAG: cyclomaltodextrinase N-terminal domain-containing protein, partial [Bacteroidales bacterium]